MDCKRVRGQRTLVCWALAAVVASAPLCAQQGVTLGEALAQAEAYLATRLPDGATLALLNINAPTRELSDYILDEFTAVLVNADRYALVDRQNLAVIQAEMNYQMSGEVSDASMQSIGQQAGAEVILAASFVPLGDAYRFNVRAIHVETARVQGQFPVTVRLDPALASLLRVKYVAPRPSGSFSTGRRAAAAALNPLLGLGSFTMGDWAGGLTVAGGCAAAAGLLAWELSLSYEADGDLVGIPGTAAFGVAGAAVAYGFVRPFVYRQAGKAVAALMDAVRVAAPPAAGGRPALGLCYAWRVGR